MKHLGDLDQTIPAHFEELVSRRPHQIAVKSKRQILSYDDLNRAANRMARAILARRGEGSEPVLLLFEPDAPLIVAMLGVLKSGKFYVQLRSSLSRARNRFIVQDTEGALILTDSDNFHLASELVERDCRVINTDELGAGLADDNLHLPLSPDNLARVVYTSGSVEEPKGVIHSHRGVLHYLRTSDSRRAEPDEDDRVAVIGLDIFTPLIFGAGCFPWNVNKEGLAGLSDWLIQQRITVYRSFPTIFRNFVNTFSGTEEFTQLRLISLIGEPLYASDIERYRKHFPPSCLLVNSLGSTETGTFRQYIINHETKTAGDVVPAGYALDGIEVTLVDEDGKEVGANCIGEIVVGSRHLSLGYWRRSDLTQARFGPHPRRIDERAYLTGDLGRMSEDGCLEYIGRKDLRVKIRNFQVDVNGVEAVLINHPAVKHATVVAKKDKGGDLQLVAYLVTRSQHPVTVDSLRLFLREKLPEYMIPTAFVTLNELPLLPAGKVDHRSLPEPDHTRPLLNTPYVAPQTPLERDVARIWAEVLQLDRIGIYDNFFDLGGHSLAATQVVSRVIDFLGVNLPAQSLLRAATVEDMTTAILQARIQEIPQEEATTILTEVEALTEEQTRGHLARQALK